MIFIGENLRYDFIHIRLCYWQYLFHCIKFFLLFCRKNIIGPQKKRKLLKQFGKKSLDANIAAIYVGGTSIMKRLVRSLLGLRMKFGINGLNTGIKMNSSISLGRPLTIGAVRQELKGME